MTITFTEYLKEEYKPVSAKEELAHREAHKKAHESIPGQSNFNHSKPDTLTNKSRSSSSSSDEHLEAVKKHLEKNGYKHTGSVEGNKGSGTSYHNYKHESGATAKIEHQSKDKKITVSTISASPTDKK